LTELAPLGLAIYGLGWDRFESSSSDPRFALLRQHWKGVLPKDDIAALYSSASVVVGTTEVEQRSLGMVNSAYSYSYSSSIDMVKIIALMKFV
jgi:hypothetical protein